MQDLGNTIISLLFLTFGSIHPSAYFTFPYYSESQVLTVIFINPGVTGTGFIFNDRKAKCGQDTVQEPEW
jgi:hypothetical protein